MVFPWPSQAEKTCDFDRCVIKRTVHSIYNRKIAPTVSKIKKEIEDTIKISKSTLTLTLLDLGYKYKKSGDNRRLLYDQRSVINDRCNYLRKIRKFREDGYEIVSFDETWVNQNHATDYMWLPVDCSDAPKIPSGKDKRLIVLHAGNREEGLIDRCDFVIPSDHIKASYYRWICCTYNQDLIKFKIIKSFLSFFRSAGFRRTFTVYNSIHRTVGYASSLACSFNQIIWE
jgi:hypothetical protein